MHSAVELNGSFDFIESVPHEAFVLVVVRVAVREDLRTNEANEYGSSGIIQRRGGEIGSSQTNN